MSLIELVADYDDWLRQRCDVVEEGIEKKHHRMAKDAFLFFRATCFRSAQQVPKILPGLSDAPNVPSVGDAHIENWGTWRDGEGRLVWGVNDFDEAAHLPFTYDLLRLATSVRLAQDLPSSNHDLIAAILEGYDKGLKAPRPCIVAARGPWLWKLINRPATKQDHFEGKLAKANAKLAASKEGLPFVVEMAFRKVFPSGADPAFGAWQKGGGSLGRPRFVAYAKWRGGLMVREAKAIVPSAWEWVAKRERPSLFLPLATGRYRSPDPFLDVWSGFVIRRLAADSQKIDLASAEAREFGTRVLSAMGRDLASIHLAGRTGADAISRYLEAQADDWLHEAAKTAEAAVREDYEVWRKHQRAG